MKDLPLAEQGFVIRLTVRRFICRYRAVATVQAAAEQVRALTRGLGTGVRPVDDTTCRVDASDDSLVRITQTLAILPAAYRRTSWTRTKRYRHTSGPRPSASSGLPRGTALPLALA
ncbi:hypothetical protein ABZX75_29235 [Streptomyces sp. NPDC003038]|uniref:hypothetical protein n=1 Tax=unclassified Streptomyces TaxID=2593676 RepID=UPI0033AE7229